jgi:hypothetical protein
MTAPHVDVDAELARIREKKRLDQAKEAGTTAKPNGVSDQPDDASLI